MTRSIHRYTVWTKARDSVVLGASADQIAACRMVKDTHHVFGPDVIRPGNRKIDPIDYIFPVFIVEMSVLHCFPPPQSCCLSQFSLYPIPTEMETVNPASSCLFLVGFPRCVFSGASRPLVAGSGTPLLLAGFLAISELSALFRHFRFLCQDRLQSSVCKEADGRARFLLNLCKLTSSCTYI